MLISSDLKKIAASADIELASVFAHIDEVALVNTERVMDAYKEFSVTDSMFAASTGYGYGDRGRDTLDKVYARIFGADSAFVRHNIISGTHALTVGLFGLLRPNDVMLSVTGKPYDTLEEVIGISSTGSGTDPSIDSSTDPSIDSSTDPSIDSSTTPSIRGNNSGSLQDFGIKYAQVDFTHNNKIDFTAIKSTIDSINIDNINKGTLRVIFIQRSKGYMNRPTLTISQIKEIIDFVKPLTDAYIVVDNCYGEFTEVSEPTSIGADLIIGSLIKNPGGGIAQSGGYLAGSARAVELAGYRMTCPGVGLEAGASLGQNRNMYLGLFNSPHVVAQAMKTAHFAAYIFDKMGYEVSPKYMELRSDIIQTIKLGSPEKLTAFCCGIQSGSPVDSFVSPEAWDMPGYADKVIMAAGTFIQGASIELSADGPLRPPYTAFLQGGLTYESGKLGILSAVSALEKL